MIIIKKEEGFDKLKNKLADIFFRKSSACYHFEQCILYQAGSVVTLFFFFSLSLGLFSLYVVSVSVEECSRYYSQVVMRHAFNFKFRSISNCLFVFFPLSFLLATVLYMPCNIIFCVC